MILIKRKINGITAEKVRIITFLQENIPRESMIKIFLAGSILRRDFNKDSDVDIFLRGKNIENADLRKFLEFSDKFKSKFGRELNVYPTVHFQNEKQYLLEKIHV